QFCGRVCSRRLHNPAVSRYSSTMAVKVKDPSVTEAIDGIDLKMLRALQKDGRISNAELAQAVDVSAATCHRRTQRLFEQGYVTQVRAMIDPKKVNRGALVMVGVVLDRSTPE